MKVLKFGGSSIGNPEHIKKVKEIIAGQQKPVIVVISAFEGITDQLLKTSLMAKSRDQNYESELKAVSNKHRDMLRQVISGKQQNDVLEKIDLLVTELSVILRGVFILQELTPKIMDNILSYGEKLSSIIIANSIENSVYIDSSEIIKTDSNFGYAKIDSNLTDKLIINAFKDVQNVVILPGFIASSVSGDITTLGRGGSDYTAAIVAAALGAESLEIWSDVDGFMTADPKKVPKAVAIDHMSYSEAIELSHFGAKIIYTPTIQPVYQKNIPIVIKNTFKPEGKGTLINNSADTSINSIIKGISSIDDVTIITLQGPGMVGTPGISMRLFRALAEVMVNILFITQASSEYSITFAIMPNDTEKAIKSINKEFYNEISVKNEVRLNIEDALSLIAIVGEKMRNTPGISATLFRALAKNGINVVSIAQGSSELNISVAIRKLSLIKALNAIHEEFFLSQYKELNLFLTGTGTIGGALLEQISKQQKKLLKNHNLKINVAGIINEFNMVFNIDGLDVGNYKSLLEKEGSKSDITEFVNNMKLMNLRNSVFIDCTASPRLKKNIPKYSTHLYRL